MCSQSAGGITDRSLLPFSPCVPVFAPLGAATWHGSPLWHIGLNLGFGWFVQMSVGFIRDHHPHVIFIVEKAVLFPVMPPVIVPEQPAFERIHNHFLDRCMVVYVHAGVVPEGNGHWLFKQPNRNAPLSQAQPHKRLKVSGVRRPDVVVFPDQ